MAENFIMLKIIRILGALIGIDNKMGSPDRAYLEKKIMPALSNLLAPDSNILFVGIDYYTTSYGRLFSKQRYHTIDIAMWRWVYARTCRHRTADLRTLSKTFPPSYFSGCLVNGVFGFGIDDEQGIKQAMDEVFLCLEPGGFLVVGWNPGRGGLPIQFPYRNDHLMLFNLIPGKGTSIDFQTDKGDIHQYLFYQKN